MSIFFNVSWNKEWPPKHSVGFKKVPRKRKKHRVVVMPSKGGKHTVPTLKLVETCWIDVVENVEVGVCFQWRKVCWRFSLQNCVLFNKEEPDAAMRDTHTQIHQLIYSSPFCRWNVITTGQPLCTGQLFDRNPTKGSWFWKSCQVHRFVFY